MERSEQPHESSGKRAPSPFEGCAAPEAGIPPASFAQGFHFAGCSQVSQEGKYSKTLTTPLSLTSLVVNGIIQARLGREQCPRSDAEKKASASETHAHHSTGSCAGEGSQLCTNASCLSSCVPVRSRAELVYSLLTILNLGTKSPKQEFGKSTVSFYSAIFRDNTKESQGEEAHWIKRHFRIKICL